MRLSAITDEISQDLDRALRVLAEYGCKDAELRNVYDKYIVDADEELVARAAADIKRYGMSVPCIDTPFFKCDLESTSDAVSGPTHGAVDRTFDDQMSLLQRAIDLCKRFDSPYIRIFSFWRRGPLTPEIEERIADALVRPCEVAARAGVTLLLENEHACYLGTGKETARVIEKVGSPALKMLWDPGNAFMAGEQAFPAGYETAKPHLAHIHIKDANVGPNGEMHWTVVGGGEIDYKGHFAALKADGYDGVVALETHWKGPDGDREKGSRMCLEAMRDLIANA